MVHTEPERERARVKAAGEQAKRALGEQYLCSRAGEGEQPRKTMDCGNKPTGTGRSADGTKDTPQIKTQHGRGPGRYDTTWPRACSVRII